jgi:hypothetical protein
MFFILYKLIVASISLIKAGCSSVQGLVYGYGDYLIYKKIG